MLAERAARPEPPLVTLVREALSARLGRPAASRCAKGDVESWIVADPVFAVLQRGLGTDARGYRTGLHVVERDITLWNCHSRALGEVFRENLMREPGALLAAAANTCRFRDVHMVHWASRARATSPSRATRVERFFERVEHREWAAFERELGHRAAEIAADLMPTLPTTGRAGTSGVVRRGTDFQLLLAGEEFLARRPSQRRRDVQEVVDGAWPLFRCFYPWTPVPARTSDLRRFMIAAGIPQACEVERIVGGPRSQCDGSPVQAAHIIPYVAGGNDRPTNGLWLCGKHHRATEGRLAGSRDRRDLSMMQVRVVTRGGV